MKKPNDWRQPDQAPKDGTQILADFGFGPQVAAWNTYEKKWVTSSLLQQRMKNGLEDRWFESELEAPDDLKRWMLMPPL